MSTALLDTKVFLPKPRRGLVPRPRLNDRLTGSAGAKLVLVSAPAGFGKTTLLVDWVATLAQGSDPMSAAWVSLDPGDNDPITFWRYVTAALHTVVPGIGESALGLLESPEPPPVQQVLTGLLNDLCGARTECLLVLDDYHVIEAGTIHESVQFVLDHMPPNLRLLIASRADPSLSLPRLRARGDLLEIRASDLRFTAAEAAAYLNGSMGLSLSEADVSKLDERTEGWIAALQLAALSLSGRDDVAAFISGFSGDDRYVVDYLVEEVLGRQPARIQDFLLQTSVLDRMTGPLCDAVTGDVDGHAVLEWLDRGNLFLVPLDDRRQWYRYHHLFADVLNARLRAERPDDVGRLHLRASGWYDVQGERPPAIRHALKGHEPSRAADLIEREIAAMRRDRREAVLRGWLEELPREVLSVRPVLCNALAGSRMSTGTFDGVEELLDDAERLMATVDHAAGEVVVANPEEFARLPAEVAKHRAGLALVHGDIEGTMRHSQQVLEVAADDDHLDRGAASALRGLAAWSSGDLETAHRSYAASLVSFEAIGHVADVLGCTIALADILVTQGHLSAAVRSVETALALAAHQGDRHLRGTVDMHVALASLHRERGDLGSALDHLSVAQELGDVAALRQNAYRQRVVEAQVLEAAGDIEPALDLLDEAERYYDGDFLPDVRPVAALAARVRARHGQVDAAARWATQRSLTSQDRLSYLHEYEHVTLARVLVAQHATDPDGRHLEEAIDLLARLLPEARAAGRDGTVIDIRVIEALAWQARGDRPRALSALVEALLLAEPEGFVRRFLDEGAPMAALLTAAAAGGASYARRVLLAPAVVPVSRAAVAGSRAPGLVEPLSTREREVLRLLGTELNGPEIARELVVSLNTVRTHTKNVYLKLGVNNRRAAVRRARELDLL